MDTRKIAFVPFVFAVLILVIQPFGVARILAAPYQASIDDYLDEINSTNLYQVANDLVTLYGPRREDVYRPFVNASCAFSSSIVYPKSTVEMAADYIQQRFESMGYPLSSITMEELPGGAGHNVFVTKVGSEYPNVFIEFSAHYDTVISSPGGNDNASGSTAVIELARVLKDYPNRYSMRFILWAAEEYHVSRGAYFGSAYHVQQALARGEQIKAGLVMDHIGWPYPGDPTGYMNQVSYNGSENDGESQRIASLFNQVRLDHGIEIGFGIDGGAQNSDEHSYWDYGLAAVSSGGGWLYYRPNYHDCGDTVANIDFTNILRTAQQNLAVGLILDNDTIGATSTPNSTPATATITPTAGPSPTATNTTTPIPTATSGPPGSFPLTGILDNFNRPDGLLGFNWLGDTINYRIVATRLDVDSSEDIYWNASSFGPDQEVHITLSAIDLNASEIGLVLKSQSNNTFSPGQIDVLYEPIGKRVQVWTYANNADGWRQRGADIPITFLDGDQFGVRAKVNGQVEVYRNGTLLGIRDVSAWPYYGLGGYIGIFNINASNAVLDDFGGGTVSVSATLTPTSSPTNTPVPPTATFTPTDTPVPPTATFTPTNTPVPPTATFTPTHTPVPPTATFTPTNTPVPPTATFTPTNTPVPPTATFTPTNTPVPPTATFTPSNTPVPPTATFTPTNTPNPTNTGLQSPSADEAVTINAGDNNGFQTYPDFAYADDGLFAVDIDSGTNTSSSYTDIGKDRHDFWSYEFSLPAGALVQGIEVRLDAKVDSPAGTSMIYVQLSWDGGVSWTTAKSTPKLSHKESTFILGGEADNWERVWSPDDFSISNFRVRVINVSSNTTRDFYLDWVAVNVTYIP